MSRPKFATASRPKGEGSNPAHGGLSSERLCHRDADDAQSIENQQPPTGPPSAGVTSWCRAGEDYNIGLTHSKLPNVPAPNLSFNGGYVEAGWVRACPGARDDEVGPAQLRALRAFKGHAAFQRVPESWEF